MTTNYFSASQLKKYASCPRQYWYSYDTDKKPTKMGAGYRQFGREIHESIEAVLTENPDLRARDKLEYKLLKQRKELDFDYPEDMNEDAEKCLRNAAKFISDRPDMDILDVEVDHKFKISRPDLNQTYRAIMDVATGAGIIDWKSGSSIRVEDEKIQGAVYMAGYTNLYNKMPENIQFVYLKKGEINTHSPGDNENELWNNMISISKQLVDAWDEGKWPAYPDSSTCYWCEWQHSCVHSGIGVEELTWEDYPP